MSSETYAWETPCSVKCNRSHLKRLWKTPQLVKGTLVRKSVIVCRACNRTYPDSALDHPMRLR